jgi:hypothetical protein
MVKRNFLPPIGLDSADGADNSAESTDAEPESCGGRSAAGHGRSHRAKARAHREPNAGAFRWIRAPTTEYFELRHPRERNRSLPLLGLQDERVFVESVQRSHHPILAEGVAHNHSDPFTSLRQRCLALRGDIDKRQQQQRE